MRTWDEAAERWLLETSHKATHADDRSKLLWLAPHLGGLPLASVNGDVLGRVALVKVLESSRPTANRYLALVRSILRRAFEFWLWIDRCPRVLLFPERSKRVRFLTPGQVERLLPLLPVHQRDLVVFALATGLRQANILGLTWSQIDLGRRVLWVPADEMKGRQALRVPLAAPALAVLRRRQGDHLRWVFTYRGDRLRWANTRAWRDALQRAGISDFRWHDLRHTWASWHAQAGTPLYVLQELGGWQSEAMVRRYAHLTPSLFASYADAVSGSLPKAF